MFQPTLEGEENLADGENWWLRNVFRTGGTGSAEGGKCQGESSVFLLGTEWLGTGKCTTTAVATVKCFIHNRTKGTNQNVNLLPP